MDTLQNCVFVGVGGALGAIGRYLMGFIPFRHSSDFPINTLLINVIGAFCIGIIAALAAKDLIHDPRTVLLLKTGICGGFTTFSTFSLESSQLFQKGHPAAGIIYVILSAVLCIIAVFAAQMLIDRV